MARTRAMSDAAHTTPPHPAARAISTRCLDRAGIGITGEDGDGQRDRRRQTGGLGTVGQPVHAGAQHCQSAGRVEVQVADAEASEDAAARPTVVGMSCNFRSAKTEKPAAVILTMASGPAAL